MAERVSHHPACKKCGEGYREWYRASTRWRRRCNGPQAHVMSVPAEDFPTEPPPDDFVPTRRRREPRAGRTHRHQWSTWGRLGIFDARIGRRCTLCAAVEIDRGRFVKTPGAQGRGVYVP